MDVQELQVGDWVLGGFNDYLQVTQLKDDYIYAKNFAYEISSKESDFYPIPITKDILGKNNFTIGENCNLLIVDDMEVWYYKNGDIIIYCKDETFLSTIFVCKNINYIHELQHILKICKIDKEIEL